MKTETQDDPSASESERVAATHPALLVVYANERPACLVLPLVQGSLEIGRDQLAAAGMPDGRASRRHVRVELEAGRWNVRDLGSRNGTFVEGRRVERTRGLVSPLVRIGRTVMLAVGDHRPFASAGITAERGVVMGPALRTVHERIALVASSSTNLLIHGGSGAGKELAAAAFHSAAGGTGPFVAINCATIQKDLADRVLFGTRRGAYTGAVADAAGLVQAAHGGTLFLDEIAELDALVQAKLLRVLETKTVTPLGAVAPSAVDFRLCAATHKDLREEVTAGRFREDLFFRVGRPLVRLPPLRERREEVPWLVDRALSGLHTQGAVPTASAEFIEACMVRRWPGNVRELLAETKTAALSARAAGRDALTTSDLDDEAGRTLAAREVTPRADTPAVEAEAEAAATTPDASVIEAALRVEQGNVARTAARLGISRSRVRRLIERLDIDLVALRSG